MLTWGEEQRLQLINSLLEDLEALAQQDDEVTMSAETVDTIVCDFGWLRDKFLTHRSVIEAYRRETRRLGRDHDVTIVADSILDEHSWEYVEREED
jgi:hypothetical protein